MPVRPGGKQVCPRIEHRPSGSVEGLLHYPGPRSRTRIFLSHNLKHARAAASGCTRTSRAATKQTLTLREATFTDGVLADAEITAIRLHHNALPAKLDRHARRRTLRLASGWRWDAAFALRSKRIGAIAPLPAWQNPLSCRPAAERRTPRSLPTQRHRLVPTTTTPRPEDFLPVCQGSCVRPVRGLLRCDSEELKGGGLVAVVTAESSGDVGLVRRLGTDTLPGRAQPAFLPVSRRFPAGVPPVKRSRVQEGWSRRPITRSIQSHSQIVEAIGPAIV